MKRTKKDTKINTDSSNNRLKKLRLEIQKSIPLNNDAFMVFAKSKKFCQEFLRVADLGKGNYIKKREV